jgi:dUTP pyrophosphatase
MKVKIKKLHPDAIMPSYAHEGDSGMDIYSVEDKYIIRGESELIKCGISTEFPIGYEIQVRPKSGLALKNGLTVLNTPGTIDAGYRGELCVILMNHGLGGYEVKKGQKVAQIVVAPVIHAELELVDELSDTERAEGGFGSTGLGENK